MPNRIAVLLPVYNDWPGLLASLRSVAQQSTSVDVWIVDDGSTRAVSQDACRREYPNCTVIRQYPNAGIVSALNLGLRNLLAAGYPYIARLDAGDLCAPTRFERQSQFLDEHPDVMLVGSQVVFRDPAGQIAHTLRVPCDWTAIQRGMHLNSCISHPAVMMPRRVFDSVGLYDPDDDCAEDYGLFFRIVETFPAINLDEALTIVEVNPKGLSLSRRRRQLMTRLRIQIRYFDAALPESYRGVLQTIALMFIPTELTLKLKRRWLSSHA